MNYKSPVGHPLQNIGFYDMQPELLLLIADNLSLGDLSNLRVTCHWVCDMLTPLFQKLCQEDVGELTVLQWAAVHGHAKLIKQALSNGAEIDRPLLQNLTFDVLGARGNLYRMDVRSPCSLANTVDCDNQKRTKIHTPLFLAVCFGHVKAIKVLLEHGARTQYSGGIMTPAHAAASGGNVVCMKAFVHPGFDINARGAHGYTFLHEATLGGEEMMKYILQLDGGAILVNARDNIGFTPLHSIMKTMGNPNCRRSQVELLLQHGANIYARDNDGYTPAHTFAYCGDSGCLQVLIDAGFDLNTRGKCGKTVLHCANFYSKKTVEYLLELEEGRNIINVEDDHQLTVLDYSYYKNDLGAREVLLRHNAQLRKPDGLPLAINIECCEYMYLIESYSMGGS